MLLVAIDCSDLLPLKENEYKIIYLEELNCPHVDKAFSNESVKIFPELKLDNILRRIVFNYQYAIDLNTKYIKEESVSKNIMVSISDYLKYHFIHYF